MAFLFCLFVCFVESKCVGEWVRFEKSSLDLTGQIMEVDGNSHCIQSHTLTMSHSEIDQNVLPIAISLRIFYLTFAIFFLSGILNAISWMHMNDTRQCYSWYGVSVFSITVSHELVLRDSKGEGLPGKKTSDSTSECDQYRWSLQTEDNKVTKFIVPCNGHINYKFTQG